MDLSLDCREGLECRPRSRRARVCFSLGLAWCRCSLEIVSLPLQEASEQTRVAHLERTHWDLSDQHGVLHITEGSTDYYFGTHLGPVGLFAQKENTETPRPWANVLHGLGFCRPHAFPRLHHFVCASGSPWNILGSDYRPAYP